MGSIMMEGVWIVVTVDYEGAGRTYYHSTDWIDHDRHIYICCHHRQSIIMVSAMYHDGEGIDGIDHDLVLTIVIDPICMFTIMIDHLYLFMIDPILTTPQLTPSW